MHLREMDANLLVVLDALLVEASVTRASERLGRSASAVSHALAKLRYVFNDELFVRAGQQLVPTAKANDIAPTVHVIISGMESLLRPTNPFNPATENRTFSIACDETHELTLIDKAKLEAASLAPGINLHRNTLVGGTSLDDLRQGRMHFVISEGAPDANNTEFLWQHLYDDSFITLARKQHPIHSSSKLYITSKNAQHTVVCPGVEGDDFRVKLFKTLKEHECAFHKTDSIFGALFSAASRDILITVPASAAKVPANQLGLVQVDQPFATQILPVYLGWHRSLDRDECHRWVRDLLAMITSQKSFLEIGETSQ